MVTLFKCEGTLTIIPGKQFLTPININIYLNNVFGHEDLETSSEVSEKSVISLLTMISFI